MPADFAELDGFFPSIDVAGSGTQASPWNFTLNDGWAAAVVAGLGASRDVTFLSAIKTDAATVITATSDLTPTYVTGTYIYVGAGAFDRVGILLGTVASETTAGGTILGRSTDYYPATRVNQTGSFINDRDPPFVDAVNGLASAQPQRSGYYVRMYDIPAGEEWEFRMYGDKNGAHTTQVNPNDTAQHLLLIPKAVR